MMNNKKKIRGISYFRYIFGNDWDKNQKICMKFDTRRFLRSFMLKLEMQKYCKILIW